MDNQVVKQLYERYGNEIYLYLYSLCRNHGMAEDLRQETFLKAILSLPETHTNMRAWLYRVARNLCFNQMKKEKRFVCLEEEMLCDNKSNDTADVLNHFIENENIRELYHALSILSQQKRELLTMQYFGGLSQKEIAAILHITPENVRVLSYRARRELKLIMEAN